MKDCGLTAPTLPLPLGGRMEPDAATRRIPLC